jgi:hypothetical protein
MNPNLPLIGVKSKVKIVAPTASKTPIKSGSNSRGVIFQGLSGLT